MIFRSRDHSGRKSGARPPFAQDRLGWWNEERQQLVYQFQHPLPGGQTYEILSVMELMKRLAELIPPPWMNLVRYYGVLAPHAKMRQQVLMLAGPSEALRLRLQKAAEKMGLEIKEDSFVSATDSSEEKAERTKAKKRASISWALLIARIFEFLPLLCPRCDTPMKMVGFITEPKSVKQVLDHLDLPTEAPLVHPPRSPPQEDVRRIVAQGLLACLEDGSLSFYHCDLDQAVRACYDTDPAADVRDLCAKILDLNLEPLGQCD